ncbi:EAL domain-containing protein [Actimicrobium sp. CCC2.4]|uniref:two-component system response regulator n=1 Tax=Actimicrobium sp. CCC2.4 TaxID=3048606 RepID=UPI002AC8ABC1|nr:EAL domain-containing protein [Actimicrobium sp. CCC2.4]MEB0135384.1 EAL domain-containing protein [Actimicrobium sp. CCC2.4]WPX32441.1 EAL domain-containing protein [Actimicrobium sp. CCC2.4]
MNRSPTLATIGLLIADPTDRRLLTQFLQQTGHQVQILQPSALSAGNVDAALCITDEQAARRHGRALLDLKQQLRPLYFPVLLTLTGNQRATGWLRTGFDDVLRLPLNKDDLLARLEAFLRLRRHSEELQRDSDLRYRSTFDLAPVGIVHTTPDGNITLANPRFGAMLLLSGTALPDRKITDMVAGEDRNQMQAAITALLAGGQTETASFDLRFARHDGSLLWTSVTLSLVRGTGIAPRHLLALIEDISLRKEMEQALRESERFVRATIDALSEHICVVNETGRLLAVNKAWANYGNDSDEVTAIDWRGFNYLTMCDAAAASGLEDGRLLAQGMRAVLAGTQEDFHYEYRCGTAARPSWFLARLTRFPQGGPMRVVVSHENITDSKLAQKHLTYLAHYDNLTGLPNRVLFYDRLKQVLLQAERSNWMVGVMFIDLDHFKAVNDTLGHAAGDTVLQQASRRILDSLRANDTVGRLGGDEFGVFLPDLATPQDAAMLAGKITQALSLPFVIAGTELFVTPSIGITLYPRDGNTADVLISSADTAMYRAKELGRNGHQFFTPHMTARMSVQSRLESSLRKALERQELSLHYQPQVDIASGRITGVEALLRWHHPEMGIISPAQFIPIAEDTGLIVPIGAWVMQAACRQNMAWQRAGLAPIVMAVNLSARQFKHNDVEAMVRDVLLDTGLDGRHLELEVTEGIVMENTEALIVTMDALKAIGVRLSLDDFGTGYSNLAYLKRFPLDTIKIDRSFVSGIGQGDDAVIAATVITLGHHLNLTVIAEGVETPDQRNVLQQLGCDIMQGYLFSRPLTAEATTALLWQHQPG